MPRIQLIRLTCDRPERERDTVEVRLTADGVTSATQTNPMGSEETWEVATAFDFEGEATVALWQVDADHSLGSVVVQDEPTTAAASPWCQFQEQGAHYTLVYRVQPSPTTNSEGETFQDGYCVAPYEGNAVRLELPKVLIYHVTRDKPPRVPPRAPPGTPPRAQHDAGEFIGDASRLVAELGAWRNLAATRIGIDNGLNDSATAFQNSSQVLADLERRAPNYTCLNREDRLSAFVLCCHGFTDGVQLGFSLRSDQPGPSRGPTRRAQTDRLLELLASICTDDVKFVLYACSTGAPANGRQGENGALAAHYSDRTVGGGWWRQIMEAARDYEPRGRWPEEVNDPIWGRTSFAAHIRHELHRLGRTNVEVYGHSDVAHASKFPGVLRFRGGGEGGPPDGGDWLVDHGPEGGSAEVRAFERLLETGTFRYRYPWMAGEEIASIVAGAMPNRGDSNETSVGTPDRD